MQEEKLVQTCYGAIELIRTRGLAKNALIDRGNQICLNGALLMAIGGDSYKAFTPRHAHHLWDAIERYGGAGNESERETFREIHQRMLTILRFRGAAHYVDPVWFNNDPATTAEDVIQLLTEVAESANV